MIPRVWCVCVSVAIGKCPDSQEVRKLLPLEKKKEKGGKKHTLVDPDNFTWLDIILLTIYYPVRLSSHLLFITHSFS